MTAFIEWLHRQKSGPDVPEADILKDLIRGAGLEGILKRKLRGRVDLPVSLVDALLQAWLELGRVEVWQSGEEEIVKWKSGVGD